jgi:hypothetical protein
VPAGEFQHGIARRERFIRDARRQPAGSMRDAQRQRLR